jgi:hypothetical protein
MGLEGIVSKRLARATGQAASPDWLKFETRRRPRRSGRRRRIGASDCNFSGPGTFMNLIRRTITRLGVQPDRFRCL